MLAAVSDPALADDWDAAEALADEPDAAELAADVLPAPDAQPANAITRTAAAATIANFFIVPRFPLISPSILRSTLFERFSRPKTVPCFKHNDAIGQNMTFLMNAIASYRSCPVHVLSIGYEHVLGAILNRLAWLQHAVRKRFLP